MYHARGINDELYPEQPATGHNSGRNMRKHCQWRTAIADLLRALEWRRDALSYEQKAWDRFNEDAERELAKLGVGLEYFQKNVMEVANRDDWGSQMRFYDRIGAEFPGSYAPRDPYDWKCREPVREGPYADLEIDIFPIALAGSYASRDCRRYQQGLELMDERRPSITPEEQKRAK